MSLSCEARQSLNLGNRWGWRALLAWYALIVPLSFIGNALPVLFVLILWANLKGRAKVHGLSLWRSLGIALHGNLGILLFFLVLCIPVWIAIEAFFPVSVIPLVAPICAAVGAAIAYAILRKRVTSTNALTTMAILAAAILTMKYLDWNPRKPLVRDMYRITTGMSVSEVESIMSSYKDVPGGMGADQSENKESANEFGDGEVLVYMTPDSADMVTVRMREGRVEEIAFSHD